MVKVIIEFDGKRFEHEGDFMFGNVVSLNGKVFSVEGMVAGNADTKELPTVMAKTMVAQVLKVYEGNDTLERLDRLCQFADEVRERTCKEIAKHKEEVFSYTAKVLGGGFRRWQCSVRF